MRRAIAKLDSRDLSLGVRPPMLHDPQHHFAFAERLTDQIVGLTQCARATIYVLDEVPGGNPTLPLYLQNLSCHQP